MAKQETVNTFDGGMIMDLNPLTTPANVLTSALNSTMITYDGDEFVLQNDMGNGRVETARLDAGYIPVGIKEYGGIIYVASVNPLTNKCQLGSFPSPERNFTTDELSKSPIVLQTSDFFVQNLNTMYVRKELLDGEDNKLRPGDKFIIGSTGLNDSLANILSDYKTKGKRILRLHLAILDDDNNISYIEDEVNSVDGYWIYPLTGNSVDDAEILGGLNKKYPYNVYKNKVSGKLLLIAELETPKTFNTSVDVYKVEDNKVSMVVPVSWDEDESEKAKLLGVKVECSHEGEGSLTRFVDFTKGYEFSIEDITKDDKLFTYAFTPYTSFGTIDYLSKRGSMNLSYIGTGKIDLVEWRYYVDQNSISISWGLEAYPRYGYQISEVKMDFRDAADPNTENVYRTRQRKSYNGNFTEYITFDESNVYFENTHMKLSPRKLYVVRIEVVSSNVQDPTNTISNITYRLMYTSSTFNSYFIANEIEDFSGLKVNCELDIDVTMESSGQKSGNKSLISNLVRDTGNVTPLDMMSYIYTSFSEDLTIKAIPILKKPSDKNFFIGEIGESDVDLNVDVQSAGITVTDYEPRYTGLNGTETYYDSIYPNTGNGDVVDYENVTLDGLKSDDNMKFQVIKKSSENNSWTGTLKGSNIKKITSDLKVVRESGSVKRIAPYIDLTNVTPSEINTLFAHEASTPVNNDAHFHFNKMIYMISGRHKRSSSERLSGYATYSASTGWQMTNTNWGKDRNYWGDLLDDNTDFTNEFYAAMDAGYGGRPVFAVLRGCGKSGDGDGRLYITSNARVGSNPWPYWNTGEQSVGWACPDGGGYDLNCNRWSFILWRTNDSNKYAAINACILSRNRDTYDGGTSLMDKLMIFLSQLYVSQYREYTSERYVPDGIYYQNAFKASYDYNVFAKSNETDDKELNIIYDKTRITEDTIKNIINDFGDVASEKNIIAELPSYNNIWYVIKLDQSIVQNYSTTVKSPNADTLISYYATAGQDSFSGLAAEGPDGTLYEQTLNGEAFAENKIYWMQRTGTPGFYSLSEKPFTLYSDSILVDSGGKISVNRSHAVEVDSSNYTSLANLLSLQPNDESKPTILLNRSALTTTGTTKRQSSENSNDWFRIYNLKVGSNLAICR
jgi:hypothetical protein|nr:MAG TPA: hypothetical protein [Caudoviricetes sp.]